MDQKIANDTKVAVSVVLKNIKNKERLVLKKSNCKSLLVIHQLIFLHFNFNNAVSASLPRPL